MLKLIAIIVADKKNFSLTLVLFLIINILVGLQANYLKQYSQYSIERGFGYYQGEEIDSLEKELSSDQYVLTTGLQGEGDLNVIDSEDSGIAVDLNSINYKLLSASQLVTNMSAIRTGNRVEKYSVVISPPNKLIEHFNIPIEIFSSDGLLSGKYPSQDMQVAIPINLAASVATNNNLSTIKQVVGGNYDVIVADIPVTVTVSGIVNSDNIIIYSKQAQEVNRDGMIMTLSNRKIHKLEKKFNIDILDHRDVVDYRSMILIFTELLIIDLLYIGFIRRNINISLRVLNFHHPSKINVCTVMLIPIIIILITNIICIVSKVL